MTLLGDSPIAARPTSIAPLGPDPSRKAWSHERKTGKDEWLTPPGLVRALGHFDLDPCAPMLRPWPTAERHYTIMDDGLVLPWYGRVWLNPPYGRHTGEWLARLVDHGDGIALIFARTETKMFFQYVWDAADAVMFLQSRLRFHNVDGSPAKSSAGAPSCLVAYGARNVEALRQSGIAGKLLALR